jgi:hypothetical protein
LIRELPNERGDAEAVSRLPKHRQSQRQGPAPHAALGATQLPGNDVDGECLRRQGLQRIVFLRRPSMFSSHGSNLIECVLNEVSAIAFPQKARSQKKADRFRGDEEASACESSKGI